MADDAAHLTIAKATHEDSLPANDSDLVLQCIDIALHSYREAVRSRSRSGRDYSISRCDNRINNAGWRYEDGAGNRADAGADADQNREAAIQPETHDDAHAVLQPGTTGSNPVQAMDRRTDVHAGTVLHANPATGAVWHEASRWSLPGSLLLDSKPDTDEGS